MPALESLVLTSEFLDSLERLSSRDQGRIFRTLRLPDDNERHPSLQVHQLHGKEADQWAAYATKGLRVTFRRLDEGRKELVAASHHYGD